MATSWLCHCVWSWIKLLSLQFPLLCGPSVKPNQRRKNFFNCTLSYSLEYLTQHTLTFTCLFNSSQDSLVQMGLLSNVKWCDWSINVNWLTEQTEHPHSTHTIKIRKLCLLRHDLLWPCAERRRLIYCTSLGSQNSFCMLVSLLLRLNHVPNCGILTCFSWGMSYMSDVAKLIFGRVLYSHNTGNAHVLHRGLTSLYSPRWCLVTVWKGPGHVICYSNANRTMVCEKHINFN